MSYDFVDLGTSAFRAESSRLVPSDSMAGIVAGSDFCVWRRRVEFLRLQQLVLMIRSRTRPTGSCDNSQTMSCPTAPKCPSYTWAPNPCRRRSRF